LPDEEPDMGPRLSETIDVKNAYSNTAGTVVAWVGTKCDGSGFSRALFVFSFGNGAATTAEFESNLGVWEASTSGATYNSRATAVLGTAITSGVLSGGTVVRLVDMAISSGTPWLRVSGGSNVSTGVPSSCHVLLYDPVARPVTVSSTVTAA